MARLAVVTVAFLIVIACMGAPINRGEVGLGNETSAIVTLKSIGVAQVAYRTSCGNGAYASSLAALAAPPGGGGSGFIDKELASSPTPEKKGYKFLLRAGAGSTPGHVDCNGTPTVTKFYASAVPARDNTGTRSFAIDERSFAIGQNSVVWQLVGNKPPTEPLGPPSQQVQ